MIVSVKYADGSQKSNFVGIDDLEVGQKVIIDTDKGIRLGIIENTNVDSKNIDGLKKVLRIANNSDYENYLKNLKLAKDAVKSTKNLVKKDKLNMNIVNAEFSLDRKNLIINFISDERIDFRDLVKELASIYKARIDLHQVGVRDKAKLVGGIGLCGRTLCCKNHLNSMCSVNINAIKNQNIALNPSKINGACGRLLCCYLYENEVYSDYRKKMPKVGDRVTINGKSGVVLELDVLNLKYKVKFENDVIEEMIIDEKA